MKACCSGCSAPSVARPSTVVTSAPSFMTASVRQELIRRPSTSTVQAPHWPWSQPFLVPVRSRRSRNASSRVVHGAITSSTRAPLTVSVTGIFCGAAAVCLDRLCCVRLRHLRLCPPSIQPMLAFRHELTDPVGKLMARVRPAALFDCANGGRTRRPPSQIQSPTTSSGNESSARGPRYVPPNSGEAIRPRVDGRG